MGAYDEARLELVNALVNWDFTPIFPSAYGGLKGVMIVPQYPYDTIENMEKEDPNFGQMTKPIISIVQGHSTDTFRSLGDNDFGQNVIPRPQGTTRKATRIGLAYLVSCWADQILGGYEMVEKLAAQVQACMFVNRTALPAFRHLRTHNSEPAYEDRPSLWCIDLHVEGDALVTYDISA